jgi:hypothetical protein
MALSQNESSVVGIYLSIIQDARFKVHQQKLLEDRWLKEVNWFGNSARRSKWKFEALNWTTIILGALTSVIAGVNVAADAHFIRWLVLIATVITTSSAALASTYRERWKRYSMTVERLRSEGTTFLSRSGTPDDAAFEKFIEAINQILREHKADAFAEQPVHHGGLTK